MRKVGPPFRWSAARLAGVSSALIQSYDETGVRELKIV
jgi:hypothetical protein